MQEVSLRAASTESFRGVLSCDETDRTRDALLRMRRVLGSRTMWHVNSTANGGGVAELLRSVLPYALDAGVDVRWLVIEANDGFLEVTKRLHHRLHEQNGDGGPLTEHEHRVYERDLDADRAALCERIRPGDVVVLHDPQTAGLAPVLRRRGAVVLWRCHVGADEPGPHAREAWAFLLDDVRAAELCVFSRAAFAWEVLDPARVAIMAPCIDVLAPKNRPLERGERRALLRGAGIVADGASSPTTVGHRACLVEGAPLPADAPFVVQVSRWDPLKDHEGVLQAFVDLCRSFGTDAHLVLAGPETDGVADDPEGDATFARLRERWAAQSPAMRERIHLAVLPMEDAQENALFVNALQSSASVVVQKSLAEGFGLTVAEAMWKERPVVASRVGGIQDQIVHDDSGFLVDDPTDLDSFARTVAMLVDEPELRERLGRAAHQRVCDRFLPLHHFEREAELLDQLLA